MGRVTSLPLRLPLPNHMTTLPLRTRKSSREESVPPLLVESTSCPISSKAKIYKDKILDDFWKNFYEQLMNENLSTGHTSTLSNKYHNEVISLLEKNRISILSPSRVLCR